MLAQILCNMLIIKLIIGLTMFFCVSPLLAVCSLSLQGFSYPIFDYLVVLGAKDFV